MQTLARASLARSVSTIALVVSGVLVPGMARATSGQCIVVNATQVSCGANGITVLANSGVSSLVVSGVNSIGIFYSPDSVLTTGVFSETLRVDGSTVLDSTAGQSGVNGGAGISMTWSVHPHNTPADDLVLNSNLTIEAGAYINAHARYGGAVFLRSEGAGNLVIDNSGTVISTGILENNTAFTHDQINSGDPYVVDGITATTHLGSVTLINRGSVTAYSGRGLYADGNYGAVTTDRFANITAVNGDMRTISIENTATGEVNAYLAGARVISYYGLGSLVNAGSIHSDARQALVVWSAAGDAYINNSGNATADDRNAVHAMTERGDVTIINSGTVVASQAAHNTQGAAYGYSGLRGSADYTGNVNITNTGLVTALYDAAVVAHTPQGDATVNNGGTLTGLNGVFMSGGSGLGGFDEIRDTQDGVDSGQLVKTIQGTAKLVNSGSISAAQYGVYMDADASVLLNSGSISASPAQGVGVYLIGGSIDVNNSGTISGGNYGLSLQNAATLTNSGTISGGTAAVYLAANSNTLNIYNTARFIGGVDYNFTTGNTTNFYTGSYTLDVKNYALTGGDNAINLLGSAKTLITNQLNTQTGNGKLIITDTSGSSSLGKASSDMQNQVSGVIGDIMSLDMARPGNISAPTAYAAEAKPRPNPTDIQVKGSADQALSFDAYGNLFWLRGFAGGRHQEASGDVQGSNARQFGSLAGVDHLFNDWRIGLYGGGGRSTNDLAEGMGSLSADMAIAGVYGRRDFGALALDMALTGGHLWADTTRTINGGAETASADFGGWFVAPELALSTKYALGQNWSLTPSLKGRYVATFFDGYSETGSSQDIRYDSHTTQSLEEKFDLKLAYQTVSASGLAARYWLGGGVSAQQRMGDAAYGATLSGADFTVATVGDANVYGGTVSLGFDVMVAENVSLFGNLEGSLFTDDSRTGMARGGVKVAF